jgi:mannose-6-phosphate isomerase-like protein (cupin superfamily)
MNTVIPKPWGQEEVLHIDDRYLLKRLTMKAGHRCSLQYHRKKNETIYVVHGSLVVFVGASGEELEQRVLQAGEHITIIPGTIHRMEAKDDCVYLEASTPEMDDVVRLSDDYSRA